MSQKSEEGWPTPRNSHSLTIAGDYLVIYGGADNENGPLSDLYAINIQTWQPLKFDISYPEGFEVVGVEMHTAHSTDNTSLIVFGGRCLKPGGGPSDLFVTESVLKFVLDF